MSKKHKRDTFNSESSYSSSTAAANFTSEEYSVIGKDLLRVAVLNVIYLVGILTLYYTNLRTHYLEHWFTSVFHF